MSELVVVERSLIRQQGLVRNRVPDSVSIELFMEFARHLIRESEPDQLMESVQFASVRQNADSGSVHALMIALINERRYGG